MPIPFEVYVPGEVMKDPYRTAPTPAKPVKRPKWLFWAHVSAVLSMAFSVGTCATCGNKTGPLADNVSPLCFTLTLLAAAALIYTIVFLARWDDSKTKATQ